METLDLRAPDVRADPYPTYNWIREHHPVYRYEPANLWFLSRHADVAAAYLRPAVFSSETVTGRLGTYAESDDPVVRSVAEMLRQAFLFRDPPAHTRLRSLINRAFTIKVVDAARPRVETITRTLLDDARSVGGPFDFVGSFAAPLPLLVIAEMLGVPAAHREQFKFWSDESFKTTDPTFTDDERREAFRHTADLGAFLTDLAAQTRSESNVDLLGALVAASSEDGERLTPDELVSMVVVLLSAGNETTTSLLCHALLRVLPDKELVAELAADRQLVRTAIEELLRTEPPLQWSSRLLLDDVTLHGTTIRRGSFVALLIAAANRDPRKFAEPDLFDARRDPNQHLSFGSGIHLCLGAPLARMEADVVLTTIARDYPDLGPTGEPPRRNPHLLARGFASLGAEFSP